MTFTDQTHGGRGGRSTHLELILALGDAVGLALGMATTRRST
jgi:hypothetical protein